jgi:hypothetical protein
MNYIHYTSDRYFWLSCSVCFRFPCWLYYMLHPVVPLNPDVDARGSNPMYKSRNLVHVPIIPSLFFSFMFRSNWFSPLAWRSFSSQSKVPIIPKGSNKSGTRYSTALRYPTQVFFTCTPVSSFSFLSDKHQKKKRDIQMNLSITRQTVKQRKIWIVYTLQVYFNSKNVGDYDTSTELWDQGGGSRNKQIVDQVRTRWCMHDGYGIQPKPSKTQGEKKKSGVLLSKGKKKGTQ